MYYCPLESLSFNVLTGFVIATKLETGSLNCIYPLIYTSAFVLFVVCLKYTAPFPVWNYFLLNFNAFWYVSGTFYPSYICWIFIYVSSNLSIFIPNLSISYTKHFLPNLNKIEVIDNSSQYFLPQSRIDQLASFPFCPFRNESKPYLSWAYLCHLKGK